MRSDYEEARRRIRPAMMSRCRRIAAATTLALACAIVADLRSQEPTSRAPSSQAPASEASANQATANQATQSDSATNAPGSARIKIDVDRTIGEIHPHLFGNFAEHLGRMIYGGIYDEGSRLADADGYRTDVMEAVRQLGVSILRWPGGNFVSGYNWKDGIGPKDKRPVRIEVAWHALE